MPLNMNLNKNLRKCNLFGNLDNFLDPKCMKLSRIPRKYFCSIFWSNSYSVAKVKLDWYPICQIWLKKLANSRGIPEFQVVPGRFQEWWNFWILYWKSSSLTKFEKEKHLICWNRPNHAKSRGFQDSWMSGFQGSKIKRCSQK